MPTRRKRPLSTADIVAQMFTEQSENGTVFTVVREYTTPGKRLNYALHVKRANGVAMQFPIGSDSQKIALFLSMMHDIVYRLGAFD